MIAFLCDLALMAGIVLLLVGYAGIVPAIERAVRQREVKRAALDAWNRSGRLYRSESEKNGRN
jgi:hypothetical protein